MPRTPMNHHAKFYAASFIPGGEIRNVQSDKFTNKQTNSNRHIHTFPQSGYMLPISKARGNRMICFKCIDQQLST